MNKFKAVQDRFLIYFLLLSLAQLYSCFETCEHATRRIDKDVNFYGRIDSLFLDKDKKNQQAVIIKGVEYLVFNEVFLEFSKGDTLLKRAGSMKYYWIKNRDTTIFYQKCGSLESDEVRDE